MRLLILVLGLLVTGMAFGDEADYSDHFCTYTSDSGQKKAFVLANYESKKYGPNYAIVEDLKVNDLRFNFFNGKGVVIIEAVKGRKTISENTVLESEAVSLKVPGGNIDCLPYFETNY